MQFLSPLKARAISQRGLKELSRHAHSAASRQVYPRSRLQQTV